MSIKLTERAAQEVKKVMEEQEMGVNEYNLRVGVASGGCSGFQYSLNFEKKEDSKEDDTSLEFEGVGVVIDQKSELYINGTVIDFHEDLQKRGFAFKNPNSVNSCGCGSSFSV